MPKTGLEIFCTKPPAKAHWAKAVAQLNREFLLNHAKDQEIFNTGSELEGHAEIPSAVGQMGKAIQKNPNRGTERRVSDAMTSQNLRRVAVIKRKKKR